MDSKNKISPTFKDLYNYCIKLIKDENFIEKLKVILEDYECGIFGSEYAKFEPQEAFLRFLTWFNCIKRLENMTMIKGNFNKNERNPYENTGDFFKSKLKAGGDSSDMTLYDSVNKKYIVFTSKNIDNVSIIGLEMQHIELHNQKLYNGQVLIGVMIKSNVSGYKDTTEEYKKLYDTVCNNNLVLTQKDLLKSIEIFKKKFINNEINLDLTKKIEFNKRFHQEWTIEKTNELIKNDVKQIIWGHVARSGKTFMMMFLINKLLETNKKLKVMIATPVPSETIKQYKETFDNIVDKNTMDIVLSSEYKNTKEQNQKNGLLMVSSTQLLKNDKNTDCKTSHIKNEYDIVFIDEAHYGGITRSTINSLKSYIVNSPVWIYVTATYTKPKFCIDIYDKHILTWNMLDIGYIKNNDFEGLIKHKKDEIFNKVLDKYDRQSLITEYSLIPKMNITTLKIDTQKINEISDKINKTELDYGWCIDGLFDVENNQFRNRNSLYNVSVKMFKNMELNESLISKYIKDDDKIVIMVYLPVSSNTGIKNLQEMYKEFLLKNSIVDTGIYEIMTMNSEDNDNPEKINNYMKNVDVKKHLIVLCGNMCSMGLTINMCDIVVLMNNTTSFDDIYQKMYRCMTERKNKKEGFIIDVNMRRSIDMIVDMSYKMKKRTTNIEDSLTTLFKTKMINWSVESMDEKNIEISDPVKYIKSEWMRPKNIKKTIKTYLNGVDLWCEKNDIIMLNKIITSELKNDNTFNVNVIENEEFKEIKKGDKVKSKKNIQEEEDELKDEEENKEDDILVKIKFEDIMEIFLPALGFMTSEKNDDFSTSIEKMKNYAVLFLNEKLSLLHGKEEQVVKLLSNVYNKMENETKKRIDTALELVRTEFKKANNDLKVLSKLVDEYLVPTENEKQKNAEVSTPRELRMEMLYKLFQQIKTKFVDSNIKETIKQGIKIFEPCVGKGGFVVDLISILMECFKEGIPDEEKRYKYIVEECIYMSELNKWNVYIVEKMINPEKKYKINMNEGDTLELDIKKKWGIRGFDVVVGNPPYQKYSNNIGVGHTLWGKFVLYCIKLLKQNSLLSLVHPSSWRAPYGSYKNIRDSLTNNNMIYLNMNDVRTGLKIFKCSTNFDWYVVKKSNDYEKTIINDIDNKEYEIDLRALEYIPSGKINIFYNLSNSDNKVETIYNRSEYGSDKKHVLKKIKSETNDEYKQRANEMGYIYPCCYTITKKDGLTFRYSNIKKGHFGIKKLIWSNGAPPNLVLDKRGGYGLTEFSYAIVDNEENLEKIKKVMESKEFIELMKYVKYTEHKYQYKVIKTFKKDFWKEFE
jgi:hypothetical protein